MEKKDKTDKWEGDPRRDLVTFRYIELAMTALDVAFEENESLMLDYRNWLSSVQGRGATPGISMKADVQPIILHEFHPEKDTSIIIYALPNPDEFFVAFKTPAFQADVSLTYNFDRFDIVAAFISSFEGDIMLSLAWAEQLTEKMDSFRVSVN